MIAICRQVTPRGNSSQYIRTGRNFYYNNTGFNNIYIIVCMLKTFDLQVNHLLNNRCLSDPPLMFAHLFSFPNS